MIEGTRTPNEAAPPLKIHGIFRSGTNQAKYMVAQQFDCAPSFHLGGHKHLPLPCIPGTTEQAWTRTVVCVKNPLASLVSLFRYAQTVKFKHFDCGRGWDEFLRGRLLIRMNGNRLWPAYRFADPVDYWNAFYANAFSVPAEHLFVLNYEELLRNPAGVMARMAARFPDLLRTGAACALPGNKLSRGADFQAQAVLEDRAFDDAAWYLERRYLSEFAASQFDFVTAPIDRDVLAGAGYAASDIAA
jgi:hypothetical protein